MDTTRRQFLVLAGLAPVVLVATPGAKAAAPACFDFTALSLSQKSRRRSLGYVEPSTDAKRHCGACSFFAGSATQAGCGTCLVLSGGPVSATGVCNSFAAKT